MMLVISTVISQVTEALLAAFVPESDVTAKVIGCASERTKIASHILVRILTEKVNWYYNSGGRGARGVRGNLELVKSYS